MKTATKTVTIYTTEDGREFTDMKEAQEHEALIVERNKNLHWFVARHSPDLTEGRGLQSTTYIAVEAGQFLAEDYAYQYCMDRFGNKIDYVQGVQAMTAWTLRELDKKPDLNASVPTIGLRKTSANLIYLSNHENPHPDTDLKNPIPLGPTKR